VRTEGPTNSCRVSTDNIVSLFFFPGSPSVATRNGWDLPLANFTVVSGEDHLERPIAGGTAESGALRFGEINHTNLTYNTETKTWEVIGFEKMFL
jgi:alkaline phosphatase D